MRLLRAFLFLAGAQLKQKSFWAFVLVFVLIGPVFVVLHSQTELDTRERRPLLSESATVDHFDTSTYASGTYGNKDTMLLFRNPASESASVFPISPAFVAGWRSQSSVIWTQYSTWSTHGSLSDFYKNIFPILMVIAGIVAFPSRRKLAALRLLLPCGRWGCFLMIAGVLVLQIVLLGVLAGASTGLALALTQGAVSGTIWFIIEYSVAIIIYGLGFALIGFVIEGLIRNRAVALLIGLVLIVGVWEYVSPLPVRLFESFTQSTTGMTPYEPNQNPVFGIMWQLLIPPQRTLDSIGLSIERLASRIEDPYVARADVLRGLTQLWAGLVTFAGFWFAISWAAFPRITRRKP